MVGVCEKHFKNQRFTLKSKLSQLPQILCPVEVFYVKQHFQRKHFSIEIRYSFHKVLFSQKSIFHFKLSRLLISHSSFTNYFHTRKLWDVVTRDLPIYATKFSRPITERDSKQWFACWQYYWHQLSAHGFSSAEAI